MGQNLWQDCVHGRVAEIQIPAYWNFNGHASACLSPSSTLLHVSSLCAFTQI